MRLGIFEEKERRRKTQASVSDSRSNRKPSVSPASGTFRPLQTPHGDKNGHVLTGEREREQRQKELDLQASRSQIESLGGSTAGLARIKKNDRSADFLFFLVILPSRETCAPRRRRRITPASRQIRRVLHEKGHFFFLCEPKQSHARGQKKNAPFHKVREERSARVSRVLGVAFVREGDDAVEPPRRGGAPDLDVLDAAAAVVELFQFALADVLGQTVDQDAPRRRATPAQTREKRLRHARARARKRETPVCGSGARSRSS